ncbi:hypothetical protein AMS68_004087 [Peltaster fructicola]|uniref:Enoyl reductase (ER) domain-containing protein n=1 Tax=Peltaster fructicola TaxID=286661 RepID=A0A6H0XVU6_9PEZI|nr:hypothetical protein AMS68_004087 [Peltaster fructicola]
MKEAIIRAGPKVEIVDSPIPKPSKNQIITKVIYSGSNPKDWKRPENGGAKAEINQGDDISGIVHEVGENVTEFKVGDRVAAFHEMGTPGGSYAEYALSWKHTTFHLPQHISFKEGAAIPLAALTAALGLYARLALPQPWTPIPDGTKIPLVVYGGSSAVGTYILQFATRSNIHPLIVVAGRAADHVEKFIDRSKGDTIIDYRKGAEAVQQGIKDALKGEKLLHAFDAVSSQGSFDNIAKVLDPHGAVTFVLPGKEYPGFPDTVKKHLTTVGDVHGPYKDFGLVFTQYISRGLDEGFFKAQPQEVIPGGLNGVEKGLSQLKDGTVSAVKYVFKIEDTPGVGK